MDTSSRTKRVWRQLGYADKAFLLALAAYYISGPLGAGGASRLLLLVLVIATGFVAGMKWLRIGIRKAIWRLRYRLIVAYMFVAVVPVLLVAILALGCSYLVAGQVAVYLLSSELDRRLAMMQASARSMVEAPVGQRNRVWQRSQDMLDGRVPDLLVVLKDDGNSLFPSDGRLAPPPDGWGEVSGIVVKDGYLYTWVRAINGSREVTMVAPITRQFLLSLAPGLGNVTILERSGETAQGTARRAMQVHDPLPGEQEIEGSPLPPPRNRFDTAFKLGANIPVAIWDAPETRETAFLSSHVRFSTVFNVIYSLKADTGFYLVMLAAAAIIFMIVELVCLFIGVSITRTITGAFDDLYEGTERVRGGDFSHRIEVRGEDQLAVVNTSFNRMTENLERLLVVAKEKERMQAELEIAQAVQIQLYPKSIPALPGLELLARCNPARMVSGDYYDYQALGDSSAVIALGDVAGKGISAALLMATLQSSLRTQVRGCLEQGVESGNGKVAMSTSRLVSQLNEQVFSDTSPEKYATFLFSVYDDKSGVLTYTNAGHLPPMLFRDGEATELDVNGMVVGAFPFAQYGESKLQMESGDLLLVFTDGITEPENAYGEMFGEQRVMDIVKRNAHLSLEEIIQATMEAVDEWTGSPELQDDMTILMARKR